MCVGGWVVDGGNDEIDDSDSGTIVCVRVENKNKVGAMNE